MPYSSNDVLQKLNLALQIGGNRYLKLNLLSSLVTEDLTIPGAISLKFKCSEIIVWISTRGSKLALLVVVVVVVVVRL